jgi:hypothetical protein
MATEVGFHFTSMKPSDVNQSYNYSDRSLTLIAGATQSKAESVF